MAQRAAPWRVFRDVWRNDDALKNRVAATVMSGTHAWLESGVADLGLEDAAFQTRSLVELRRALAQSESPQTAVGS